MASRAGGRPRRIDEAEILRAGREIGLRDLSMTAVASALGVSATALYRHIDGRWGLERLVGESILRDLELGDDPAEGIVPHLVSFGLQLREHMLRHPGLAAYLQTLFPRGDGGLSLLAAEVRMLEARGYARDTAMMLSGAVASIVIGYAAAEDLQRNRTDGLEAEQAGVVAALAADAELGDAHRALPAVGHDEYVRLMLTAVAVGFVEVGPAGRSVAEVVETLMSRGAGN